MKDHRFRLCLTLLAALAGSTTLSADVKLPAIISDHMVLQKTAKVPLWGKADPGEAIAVRLAGLTAQTKADGAGKWMVSLDLAKSAPGPFDLVISGKNEIKIADVLVGEVWLASGQSNMEFLLKDSIGATEEIAQSTNPWLRQFHVKNKTSAEPLEDCEGQWVLASPETSGAFSGVGYYFARKLQNDLQAPVGLIHSSWGATPAEAWTSRMSLDQVPALKATTQRHIEEGQNYPTDRPRFVTDFKAWLKQTGREDHPVTAAGALAGEGVSIQSWIPVKMTGPVTAPGLPETGAIWLRREYNVSAEELHQAQSHQGLGLDFGDVTGFETVYWNGEEIGAMTMDQYPGLNHPHSYKVPADKIKEGINILAVRVFAPVAPPYFKVDPQHPPATLGGTWLAKPEFELSPLTASALTAAPKPPVVPWPPQKFGGYNFNGMIAPLIPYAMRGVIWYQGEGNVGRAYQYRTTFPLLITDWRKHWKEGDFPFYFCQLANFHDKKTKPGDNDTAELREAQSLTLHLPNTGQAVLIDIGEAKDIHPRNKKDAGERLARIALARDYGKDVAYSGPVYKNMKIEGDNIRLTFTQTDGGLVAKPLPAVYDVHTLDHQTAPVVRNSPKSELEGFAVCGADHQWVWADARIEGNSVVVSSAGVSKPVAVRYAWADNPTCNFYNGAGLPASPFRTDDFPAVTQPVVDW